MIAIKKQENIGNTFLGLVCAAFGVSSSSSVTIDAEYQHGSCGTVEVCGVAYDWFDRGESVEFLEAK